MILKDLITSQEGEVKLKTNREIYSESITTHVGG